MVRAFLAAVLAGALAAPGAGIAGAQPAPYEIQVMLPLTGPAAFLGKAEQQFLQVYEKSLDARGGIKGRSVKFIVSDDQSNPQTGLQLANSFVAKKVPVFIGSALAAVCDAYAGIIAKGGPVNMCLSPLIHPPAGSFIFTGGASSRDDALVMARYFRDRGLTRVAMICSSDASGQEMDDAFPAVLQLAEFRGVQLVARERFNLTDIGAQAQIARMKAANPNVILTWTTGTSFGTLLRALRDAGLDALPVAASNGNQLYGFLAQFGPLLPGELLFPGYRAMTETDARGAVKDAQNAYFKAFRDAGIKPDVAPAAGWDRVAIVIEALQKLPAEPSAEQVRSAIADLRNWAGINGLYDFRNNQQGIGASALVMHRWDAAKGEFAVVSKPGGAIR